MTRRPVCRYKVWWPGIDSGQRPFWTGGPNAGPQLTNKELNARIRSTKQPEVRRYLKRAKSLPFDEVWYRSVVGEYRTWLERVLDKTLYRFTLYAGRVNEGY